MALAKSEWGHKRICQGCGCKFYDLKRNPIVCPSCNTEIDPEALLKSRRPRNAPAKTPKPAKVDPKPAAAAAATAAETAGGDDDIDDDELAATVKDAVLPDDEVLALADDDDDLDADDDEIADVVVAKDDDEA